MDTNGCENEFEDYIPTADERGFTRIILAPATVHVKVCESYVPSGVGRLRKESMSGLKVQRRKLAKLRDVNEGAAPIRVNPRASAVDFRFVRPLYSRPCVYIRGFPVILASIRG
jgi:hypothetical protein